MKAKELREKTTGELERLIMEKRNVLRELKFLLASGKVKNHRLIGDARRAAARARTILAERMR